MDIRERQGNRTRRVVLFWPTCMVENAVVGMSVSLAEETAVKDPEDDEAVRADDVQMEAEWFDGIRNRQRKRRVLVLSWKLKPRLWQTTAVNRPCCQYFSARAKVAGAHMVLIDVDAAVVGGLHRMLEFLTVPVGSGCLVAQTDTFGSKCVASTRNFHERVTANEKFMDKLFFFFANLCFLFQAHTILRFHVFTIVSACSSPPFF